MKHFMLIALLLILFIGLSGVASAQGGSKEPAVDSTSSLSSILALSTSDGGVDGVIRGKTYTVVYDPFAATSSVYPNDHGEVTNGDIGVDITGDPTANIVVEMSLPQSLLGIGGSSMTITFPTSGPGSGVRGETGEFFDPNVSNTFNLGLGGACTLRLGYVIKVPVETNITGDSFVGQILTNSYYTGL